MTPPIKISTIPPAISFGTLFSRFTPGARFGRSVSSDRYWDTEFVRRLGPNVRRVAADLNGRISDQDVRTWSQGGPAAWAMESFRIGRDDAYGRLPQPSGRGGYRLPEQYITMATQDVVVQLAKAGIRLAFVLNHALGAPIR